MNTQIKSATPAVAVHKGPHPGMLAVLYTVLFCAGLYPVTLFYKLPYWPGPWEPDSVIVPFFQTQGGRVLLCMFLQLGAMICLGLFTATIVSRLHFLGARAIDRPRPHMARGAADGNQLSAQAPRGRGMPHRAAQ